MATLTKKEIQNILRKKMIYANETANKSQSIDIKGISKYNYYAGLAEGYRKALELIGNMKD